MPQVIRHRIDKPWGYEIIWARTDKYVAKVLHINAGHKLSKQYHVKKDETFLVQSGALLLQIGKDPGDVDYMEYVLGPGCSFHCPAGTVHRMCAVEVDVDVLEVSTPELDDVVRLADDYGR